MGTDIHIEAELKNLETGRWEAIPVPRHLLDKHDLEWLDGPGDWKPEWVSGRNYALFAILASVRNWDEGFVPISEPRGFPDDMSDVMLTNAYGPEHDPLWFCGHSASWLSLREVAEYPVKDMEIVRSGVLNLQGLRDWRESGRHYPLGWAGGVAGPNVEKVKPGKLESFLTNPPPKSDPKHYVARFQWKMTYYECAEYFFGTRLPELLKIVGDRIDDARLVFWFDS